MDIQHKLDASAMSAEENLETQRLDISISRRWLQVLGWQISVKRGLLTLQSHEGPFDLRYPIELAKDVVQCVSTASQTSIDSHGIGMVSYPILILHALDAHRLCSMQEQKLADVANCLSDVLKCAEGDTSEPFHLGREYLSALLHQLSRIRGVPSRYLQPLLEKTSCLRMQIPPQLPMLGWEIARSPRAESEEGGQLNILPIYFSNDVL